MSLFRKLMLTFLLAIIALPVYTQTDSETDTTRPISEIYISMNSRKPQQRSFEIFADFSEPVTGFTASDINITGTGTGTVTKIEKDTWCPFPNGVSYIVTVTPTADGTFYFQIPENVVTDAANNGNLASTKSTIVVTVDTAKPTTTISTVEDDPQTNPFNIDITFSEHVTNWREGNLKVTGGGYRKILDRSQSDYIKAGNSHVRYQKFRRIRYKITLDPGVTSLTFSVPEYYHTDLAQNKATASNILTVEISSPENPDVNNDGSVDINDLILVINALDQSGSAITNAAYDINNDNVINKADLLIITSNLD